MYFARAVIHRVTVDSRVTRDSRLRTVRIAIAWTRTRVHLSRDATHATRRLPGGNQLSVRRSITRRRTLCSKASMRLLGAWSVILAEISKLQLRMMLVQIAISRIHMEDSLQNAVMVANAKVATPCRAGHPRL